VLSPLRIVGLRKTFGATVAIDDLQLAVPAGACYGLVGPNGSGKSTTMRAVVGLVRPDAGVIEVCRVRVDVDVLATRRSMGVMLGPAATVRSPHGVGVRRTHRRAARAGAGDRPDASRRAVRRARSVGRRRPPDRRLQPRHATELFAAVTPASSR
jgi:ABC-2 type transport system ATP-binding protein